ncbi:hypothetical protein QE152_g34869 [Popillia japonica]|uniref:Uncharacterized protein n=1 Tax=Popillia japonica TaxID=7064 RepID=A0AAW1ISH6_POPJA
MPGFHVVESPHSITKNSLNEKIRPYDKIQVLALAKIEEVSDETDTKSSHCRRPSIKIDNWDLVFSENNKSRCQIHLNNDNVNANATNNCGCKSKTTCNEHADCLLPEIPLDARKVTTLRRHYYTEGGWGWLVLPAAGKFKTLPVHVAGKFMFAPFFPYFMMVVSFST